MDDMIEYALMGGICCIYEYSIAEIHTHKKTIAINALKIIYDKINNMEYNNDNIYCSNCTCSNYFTLLLQYNDSVEKLNNIIQKYPEWINHYIDNFYINTTNSQNLVILLENIINIEQSIQQKIINTINCWNILNTRVKLNTTLDKCIHIFNKLAQYIDITEVERKIANKHQLRTEFKNLENYPISWHSVIDYYIIINYDDIQTYFELIIDKTNAEYIQNKTIQHFIFRYNKYIHINNKILNTIFINNRHTRFSAIDINCLLSQQMFVCDDIKYTIINKQILCASFDTYIYDILALVIIYLHVIPTQKTRDICIKKMEILNKCIYKTHPVDLLLEFIAYNYKNKNTKQKIIDVYFRYNKRNTYNLPHNMPIVLCNIIDDYCMDYPHLAWLFE